MSIIVGADPGLAKGRTMANVEHQPVTRMGGVHWSRGRIPGVGSGVGEDT